jgi:ABC-2 type transport system permease protein
VVGVFYSLDALYGERRDRSILFWKSLPVSDLTAVLSKASIPLVVLPALVFVITVATNLVMVLISSAVLVLSGINPMTLWRELPLFQFELVLLYALRFCGRFCRRWRSASLKSWCFTRCISRTCWGTW